MKFWEEFFQFQQNLLGLKKIPPPGEIYTDSTGTDLTQFIINTLNKNSKDRVLMLKLEQEMTNLVQSILISKPGDSLETEFSGEGWEEDSP